jgi:outer membrane protein
MNSRFILIYFLVSISIAARSQDTWDLKRCVEYAMANNPAVAQTAIQAKISALNKRQQEMARIPTLSAGTSMAFNSGNNQDPTTFVRVTQNYLSAGMQLQSSAEIFNFYRQRLSITAASWELMASQASIDKVRNDIALSTANAFLQVLLSEEQVRIAVVQIGQTTKQLEQIRKRVAAGALPELNATQLEAQLAQDSSNLIGAQGSSAQSVLLLKQWMNLDPAIPFEAEKPDPSLIPLESISDLQPEYVLQEALKNQPQQQVNQFRLKAAEYATKSANAARMPTISAFASLGTSYLAFEKRALYERILTGYQPTGFIVDANGVQYDVQAPIFANGPVAGYLRSGAFFNQLETNFRKAVGLSVNIPILNGGSTRMAYERAKLNIQSVKVQQQQDEQKLKQDIYQAYQAALVAMQRFHASEKSVEVNEKAYAFATRRLEIGALSTYDWITTQNNLLRARLERSLNQVDYVFKMKVLEFYKGKGLKL